MAEPAKAPPTRLLLVGYGRMGRLVEELSREYECEVAAHVDGRVVRDAGRLSRDQLPQADVIVDFSTADAFIRNLPALVAFGVPLVVGTTGWLDRQADVRRVTDQAGLGVVAAANFSLGVTLFEALAERAAALFAPHTAYGPWIHEVHHAAKLDAPSGTAVSLQAAMVRAGLGRPVDVSSTRAGSCPGTHTIGFDGPSDAITLTHEACDRSGFARGALVAARWIQGRRGWFSMRDVLGVGEPST